MPTARTADGNGLDGHVTRGVYKDNAFSLLPPSMLVRGTRSHERPQIVLSLCLALKAMTNKGGRKPCDCKLGGCQLLPGLSLVCSDP